MEGLFRESDGGSVRCTKLTSDGAMRGMDIEQEPWISPWTRAGRSSEQNRALSVGESG